MSDFETYEIDNLNVFSARGGYYAYLEGLMGGTQSLWDGSADVTIVGWYDDSFDTNPSHIWYWDDSYSYNYDISSPNYETYTTYDGGAYYGFTGGIELDNKLEGKFFALYIDPNFKIEGGVTYYPAGYLSGDLAGTAYPDDIQMFEMGGILNTNPVTEIDMVPSDLESSLYWGEMEDCYLGGSFDGADSLVGQNDYIYYLPSYYGYSMAYTLSIEGQPWGIYGFTLGGDTSGGIPTNWEAAIGYWAYWGSYDYGEDEGYWLATIDGTDWSYGRLAGELSGKAIGYYHLYEISGNVLGTYNTDDGTWQAVSLGTYTGKPLTFWSEFDPSLHFYDSVTGFNQDGDFTGFMGGIESLWDGSAEVTIIGEYNNDDNNPSHIWYTDWRGSNDISSYNYKNEDDPNTIYTTYDGGAYRGFTGGIELNNELKGMFLALYIDPSGNAGYLSGNLTGTTYPDIYPDDPWGMFEAGGRIYPVQMETSIDILPGDLLNEIGEGDIFFTGDGDFFDTATGIDTGDIVVAVSEGYSASISGQDWGIWTTMLGGTYADSTSDWSLHLSSQNDGSDHWAEVVDTDWSTEGEIAGKVAGAWVNLDDAMTSVMGGELKGAFDPDNTTWQAVAAGSWIETNQFLTMADNETYPEGNPTLQQLNIPCIEIGRTNLSGGNPENMTVNMIDVTFFAYSAGVSPKIWATGDVNGTYSTLTPTPVILTGNNFGGGSATFTMNNMIGTETNTGNWDAGVVGSGTVNAYPINIEGGAAGTYMGTPTSGAFDGTGAGIATPTTQ